MKQAFGSTLSAGGFAALQAVGVRPLQQVQGTALVHLGVQRRPSRGIRRALRPTRVDPEGIAVGSGGTKLYYPRGAETAQRYAFEGGWFELEERTAAYNDVRHLALGRMRDTAGELGAAAVVDVRVRRGRFAHAAHVIEFTALGTAVASDVDMPAPIPLTSLGGGDLWKLLVSGFRPLGLVGGTSVAYVISGYRTKFATSFSRLGLQNQEHEDFTKGFAGARVRAAGRLRLEAQSLGAAGVLGIEVRRERHQERDDNLVLTVDLLGNAIASIEQPAPLGVTPAIGVGER